MAAITDAEVDRWLADNDPPPPWARSRPYLRSILQQDRDARLAADARKAAAAPQQTSELAQLRAECQALRRRVKALEMLAGTPSKPNSGLLMETVAAALRMIREEITAEIASARDRMAKFDGVYQSGKGYSPNTLCVSKGSLWISKTATTDEPGRSSSWQLVTKRGTIVEPRPSVAGSQSRLCGTERNA